MTPRKRCENCLHWGEISDTESPMRPCYCPAFFYDDAERKKAHAADGLHYWDYESYNAGFETGPHFGCVHWVRKI